MTRQHERAMTTPPKVRASITAAADRAVDLTVISDRTGLVATQVGIAGEDRVTPSEHHWPNPSPRSFWCLCPDAQRTFDLNAVLDDLLDVLHPAEGALRAVAAELDLDLWVSLHLHMEQGQAPDGTISRRSLQRIASIGADLDLDLYPGTGGDTDGLHGGE